MLADNLIFDLESTKCAIVVSEPDTKKIVYMNEPAQKLLDLSACESVTVDELYELEEDEQNWYDELPMRQGEYGFLPMKRDFEDGKMILDSVCCFNDGNTFRLDTFTPVGLNDANEYYARMEMASGGQRWDVFSSDGTDDNIMKVLKAALYVYAADRAFVIELDRELKCLADVYSLSRLGFVDKIENVRPIGDVGIDMLTSIYETGNAYINNNYQKNEAVNSELSDKLYGSLEAWNNMIVPFQRQSGIRCFLCIDNYRRFYNNTSLLRYFALLVSNCMYAEKMRDNMAAAKSLSAKLSHTPENRIYIDVLGGFYAHTSTGAISQMNAFSAQCGTLFMYLLCNRNRVVPAREIAEVLWPGELIDNPYNMVKNAAFRTRKIFESLTKVPVIVAGNGTYSINSDLDIRLDIEEFEKFYKAAKAKHEGNDIRLESCRKAFEIYKGSLLPNFDAEVWILNRTYYYRLVYADLIKTYIMLLSEKNDYIGMFDVAAKAMEKERLDNDVHMLLLEILLKNNKKEYAMNYYSRVKVFFDKTEEEKFKRLLGK